MTNVKKIILGVVCIMVLSGGVIGGKYLISVQKYKKIVNELKIGSVDLSKVSDGKYTGSCDAEFVAAKVSVTVKDHMIKDITLLSHKTERGKSAEVIPGNVVKAQSLQVDTITGATNSSKVILKSIENALNAGKS
ncbi:FMN-binding protein [Clostridium estertheticum]|uniref:FMN-binding protein n=1 Tax=Clostridium estertheticum TaxID=238834 RepID=UPI001C0E583B|nr:FMN-binding protein [Clostridium estertheticum]MBU3216873.1 FMN-binding protein [Clostridium estertheticum]WAG53939.1 FMN-binding protein [Clostridium estertheticum]